MEQRSTKFSLLVTGIFLIGLLALAAILKPTRPNESSAMATSAVQQTAALQAAPQPTQQMLPPPPRSGHPPVPAPALARSDEAPSVPEMKARQQILTQCKLKADQTNDGDSFIVTTRSGEYRFSLYFVDAPELNRGSIEQFAAHRAYFGYFADQQEDHLRAVAQSAKKYVSEVLANRTFDVVTRWERSPEESPQREITCRAFLYLTADNGEPTNLASLLVAKGLATICASTEALPDRTPPEVFQAELQRIEQTAIAQKLGAWQFSDPISNEHAATWHTPTAQAKYITR